LLGDPEPAADFGERQPLGAQGARQFAPLLPA
jgi:hypothetical protein